MNTTAIRHRVVIALLLIGLATAVGCAADSDADSDATTTEASQTPTGPATTPGLSEVSPADEAFLTGRAPTPERLQGVWRQDGDVLLVRFSPPNLVSFDNGGLLFESPAVHGTYGIAGDLITVHVDGGYAGCGGQEFAMRASLPQEGQLRFVHTRPGTGNCAPSQNERWSLQQVRPRR
jgi:hypothetical protein